MLVSETAAGPLVTFALFAYNQQRFIREAVEAAFSQTYSPLEIILSDDCSSDRTFEIIEELASGYQGPHQVTVIRNTSNLGIAQHINRVMEIAKGELIVGAAGDDISMPDRTAITVGRWLDRERIPRSIYSRNVIIDSAGVPVGEVGSSPRPGTLIQKIGSYMEGVLGCSHAWSRDVFEKFGPILPDTICEDRVIPFRSAMLGEIEFISRPLVKYRVHEGNLSLFHETDKESVLRMVINIDERNIQILDNYRADLKTAAEMGLLPARDVREIRKVLIEKVKENRDKIDFLQAGSAGKMRMIRSSLLRNPPLALRRSLIFLFPNLYIKFKHKKPAGVK